MPNEKIPAGRSHPSRREFLKASALAAVSAGAVATVKTAVAAPHVGGSDLLKVGLVGCGGRGTGAAVAALMADPNVKLVAMADAFEDRLQGSLESLKKQDEVAGKVDVPNDRQFVGFDAYKQLIASGVDVVIAGHAAPLPPAAPEGGGRGRRARLRREAGRRRRPRRPLGAGDLRSRPRRKPLGRLRASACGTTTASARPSGASTTAPSATSSRSRPTTTAARSGSSRASPTGPTCTGRCATGTTSPGSRATSTSSSTSISSTSAPGR